MDVNVNMEFFSKNRKQDAKQDIKRNYMSQNEAEQRLTGEKSGEWGKSKSRPRRQNAEGKTYNESTNTD